MLWIPSLDKRIITHREAHLKATPLYGLLDLSCRPGSSGLCTSCLLSKPEKRGIGKLERRPEWGEQRKGKTVMVLYGLRAEIQG